MTDAAQPGTGRLKVGIIGGGWIARRHVPAIDAAPEVELVAACDADVERAHAIADPRGAHAYQDWRELLDREQLDAIWVCTPPGLHRDPTVAALERGVHVFLEKPLARSAADGEAIVAAAAGGQGICMVGYQWHATELLDDVRAATEGQAIAMLTGRNYGPTEGRPWFVDGVQGGGQILERGSHHIDLQRAIAGEIEAVQATAGTVTVTPDDKNIDDVLTLTFHFGSGALGSVSIAWTRADQPHLYSLDVIAERASIWVQLGVSEFSLRGAANGADLSASYGDPFDRSVGRFLEVVRTGDRERVFCTPDDALRTLEVALACERALAEGGTVTVHR
jgi:myo-inositol 2-dehydrogenase / D-chiro-inositol 1-dehydrogenase